MYGDIPERRIQFFSFGEVINIFFWNDTKPFQICSKVYEVKLDSIKLSLILGHYKEIFKNYFHIVNLV